MSELPDSDVFIEVTRIGGNCHVRAIHRPTGLYAFAGPGVSQVQLERSARLELERIVRDVAKRAEPSIDRPAGMRCVPDGGKRL